EIPCCRARRHFPRPQRKVQLRAQREPRPEQSQLSIPPVPESATGATGDCGNPATAPRLRHRDALVASSGSPHVRNAWMMILALGTASNALAEEGRFQITPRAGFGDMRIEAGQGVNEEEIDIRSA